MKLISTYLNLSLFIALASGAFAQGVADIAGADSLDHVVGEQKKSSKKVQTANQKRAAELLKFKADYLAKVASGKIDPLASFKKSLPKLQKDLPALRRDFQRSKNTKNSLQKRAMESSLLLALQPIGHFLNNAQHRKTDKTLTSFQIKEIKRIQEAQQTVSLTKNLKLRGLKFSPLTAPFTLLDLPVPITLHAPPNTRIYLESTTGGRFPNGTAFIEIRANDEGVASTNWVSHGDSVADNNLRTLTDGNGNDNQWIYDARNLKVTKIYPGNAGNDFYRLGYDALNRVAIKVDQIGTSCTNVYDLAGRMVEKQYHTGATPALGGVVTAGASLESTDTFTFDSASRVIATHKGRHDITTEHSYALDSQPLSETIKANGDTYTSSRTYDAANRPLSHTFPNGKTTQWSYTARNLVSTVRYEDELIATNTYDAGLRQTNQNYGNGLNRVITYARQDNLRSTDRVLTKDDLNFSYTYAVDKQVTAESIVADQVEDTSFTASYDAGNRLTAWNRAGADENHNQTWDYDNAGNWNSTTKDGDTEARNHSVSNQITQLDGKAVSHDLKGNLTEYEYDRTDYRVKYDLDNRIVEVKADSETIRYRYDALGRRIVSKGDDETVLIWWGDSECAEYEHRASQDAIQNDIMGHPTRLNSVIARDTEDRENRVELQWYHKNYLDHVYAVSDDNGNLIEHYRYTAFGEPEIYSATGARRNTSAIGNTVMWNTRRYDADNGLYYYKYRHYAANIGRWLGRDPLGDEAFLQEYVSPCNKEELIKKSLSNLYTFIDNQPLVNIDVFGLCGPSSIRPSRCINTGCPSGKQCTKLGIANGIAKCECQECK